MKKLICLLLGHKPDYEKVEKMTLKGDKSHTVCKRCGCELEENDPFEKFR